MQWSTAGVFPLWLFASVTFTVSATDAVPENVSNGKRLQLIALQASANVFGTLKSRSACTKDNIVIRKEWRHLSKPERKAYSDAVLCIQQKPSLIDPVTCPGCKSLYDDFVAIHINQSFIIHFTANFLTWHRYYTWIYEQTLKRECGYKGTQPYWEWGLDVESLRASPLFDGSPYSMGSDGVYIPRGNIVLQSPPPSTGSITIYPGTGGGCVFSGPFVNFTVNLGPLALPPGTPYSLPPVTPMFAYNPRCLKRDFTASTTKRFCSFQNTTELILNNDAIFNFQTTMDGDPRILSNLGTFGVHGGGHFSVAGDPGGDFEVSPGDPYFFLHHAQIDRVYSFWQNLYLSKRPYRQTALWGTQTFLDNPPSPNGTLNDILDFGPLAPPIKIRDAMSTVNGAPFCYWYA